MVEKLVVCIMGQNCEKFIGMCLESVKDADAIVYCDGGSEDETKGIYNDFRIKNKLFGEFIYQDYNQEDKTMNGKQRNFYLKHLQENYKGYWALCLDADEVVDDLDKIKTFINTVPKEHHDILFSIKMRHFIGNLGQEDATQQVHYVPNRLFKVRDNLKYPECEHPVLGLKEEIVRNKKVELRGAQIQPTTIWHLAYIPNLFEYKKKYENHLKKSNMHTPEYLKNWYRAHIFGMYPTSRINVEDIPAVILNEFGIDKDEVYFANRMQLEAKHFIMCKQWYDKFKPITILDIGAGAGHYGYVFRDYLECAYTGIDKSSWVIENCPYKELDVLYQDITKGIMLPDSNYDLVLCVDILEHLEKEKLDFVLSLISKLGKNFIFSIPFINDPHLDADKTHLIKESKEWWVERLSDFFRMSDTPKEWLFSNQILIGEKK